MGFYLAIDQGGTKTDAIVVSASGDILSAGNDRTIRAYGENYALNQAQFIRLAAGNALSAAGIGIEQIDGVCAALNGADWDHDYPRLRALTADALETDPSKVTVINDCIGAMRGGTADRRCAVLCIGSGLNCAVRNGDEGEIIYGYFIAECDQGGGALGREVWRAVVDQYNGLGRETLLTPLTLEHFSMDAIPQLYIAFTDGTIPFDLKRLAPVLMRAAVAGDAVALGIIAQTSDRLCRYITCAMDRLGMDDQPLTLVISGGVTKGDGCVLTDALRHRMRALKPAVRCVSAAYEPVAGTALVALDAQYARAIPEEVNRRFCQSAQRIGLMRNV